MRLDLRRLHSGELLAGLGSVLLLVALFALCWYKVGGVGLDGWDAHSVLRWFMLLTAAAGLALVVLTAAQDTPALPVTAATLASGIAAITTLLVAYRVVLNEPGPNGLIDVCSGAWVGLLACALVLAGAAWSMRDETPR